jgi:hypothetical protein
VKSPRSCRADSSASVQVLAASVDIRAPQTRQACRATLHSGEYRAGRGFNRSSQAHDTEVLPGADHQESRASAAARQLIIPMASPGWFGWEAAPFGPAHRPAPRAGPAAAALGHGCRCQWCACSGRLHQPNSSTRDRALTAQTGLPVRGRLPAHARTTRVHHLGSADPNGAPQRALPTAAGRPITIRTPCLIMTSEWPWGAPGGGRAASSAGAG